MTKAETARLRRAQRDPALTRMATDLALACVIDQDTAGRLLVEAWQRGIASWGHGSVTITVRSDHIKAELDQLGDA